MKVNHVRNHMPYLYFIGNVNILMSSFAASLFTGAMWRLAFGNVGFYDFAAKRATRREYAAQAVCCAAIPCPSNAQR